MKTIKQTLAENLKKLRKEKGISQDTIAAYLKIHRSTYSYYELGTTSPKLDMLEKIATYYHVSIGFLLCDNTKK